MTQTRSPLIGAYFSVDLQGGVHGAFRECTGLGSDSQVVEYRSADERGRPVLIREPGAMKYQDIVLKRGITASLDLWQWRRQIEDGDVAQARRNGTITLHDQRGEAVARWTIDDAWPSKLTGPTYDARSNEVAVEELTVTHQGYRHVQ